MRHARLIAAPAGHDKRISPALRQNYAKLPFIARSRCGKSCQIRVISSLARALHAQGLDPPLSGGGSINPGSGFSTGGSC
jgi:hypothetical protein